jgi:hypothetical protein
MTLPIYPDRSILKGLGFTTRWAPTFFNMETETTASGADIDIALAQYPLHSFELTYNFLRDAGGARGWGAGANLEFRTLMGFWLQLGGTAGRFLFRNPDDCVVAAQQIAVGDGSTTTFTVIRSFGANGYGGAEAVGQIDTTQPVIVRLGNAVQPPSTWALNTASPVAQTLSFATAPSAGSPIYMDFAFFYYCKFADNANTFEKFAQRLWALQKVSIKSCRPGT